MRMPSYTVLARRKLLPGIVRCLVAGAVLAVGGQPASAKAPSCTRGGAEVLASNGPMMVVRAPARPFRKESPKDTDVLSCWRPTGKRGHIEREYTGEGSGTFSDMDND